MNRKPTIASLKRQVAQLEGELIRKDELIEGLNEDDRQVRQDRAKLASDVERLERLSEHRDREARRLEEKLNETRQYMAEVCRVLYPESDGFLVAFDVNLADLDESQRLLREVYNRMDPGLHKALLGANRHDVRL